MRRFLKNIILFSLPILGFIFIVLSQDVFKVFGNYENFYEDNFVSLNRGVVTFKMYEKNRKANTYNAFIFGNSRSQAFKCENWKKYLPSLANPYHFDASGEGIYGVAKKIEYIYQIGEKIDHALIIVDHTFLQTVNNRSEHIAITPPTLTGESFFHFYKTLSLASLDPDFLMAYFDYKINGTHKPYMKDLIRDSKYPDYPDLMTGDLYYGYDEWIKKDSLGYYQRLIEDEVFYDRSQKDKTKKCIITTKEMMQLKSIRQIFELHNTQYKIIVSPLYDQISLDKEQVDLLYYTFGKENVFDFSGKNIFTEKISNYYEASHFRPFIANKIIKEVYSH